LHTRSRTHTNAHVHTHTHTHTYDTHIRETAEPKSSLPKCARTHSHIHTHTHTHTHAHRATRDTRAPFWKCAWTGSCSLFFPLLYLSLSLSSLWKCARMDPYYFSMCLCVCVSACLFVFACVYVCVCEFVCVCVCLCVCARVIFCYVSMCVSVCLCVCVRSCVRERVCVRACWSVVAHIQSCVPMKCNTKVCRSYTMKSRKKIITV